MTENNTAMQADDQLPAREDLVEPAEGAGQDVEKADAEEAGPDVEKEDDEKLILQEG